MATVIPCQKEALHMGELLLPLGSIAGHDRHRAGNKAASLALLLQAGFPVPEGLCLTTDAFDLALAGKRKELQAILAAHTLADPAEAGRASRAIEALLADLLVPPAVCDALGRALPAITDPATPLAVRSSAPAEDCPDVSFAGQYITVLGVRGEAALLDAVVACWRSLYQPGALAARATAGLREEDAAMAVLIQPTIDAECAGVCFSVDPVAERRDRLVVSAAWGLGTGVVGGSVAADTAWVRRHLLEVEQQRLVVQAEQWVLDVERGVRLEPVPQERRDLSCLPVRWLQRVAAFGVAAEVLLGGPQEVEWAIAERQVWLLQSRPIAALPPALAARPAFPVRWEDETDARRGWSLEELSGADSEPLLPLEIDYVAVEESVRADTCRWLGAERNQDMRVINGRIYFSPTPSGLTEGDLRVRRAWREDLADRLWQQGLSSWDYWGPEVESAVARLGAFDLEHADGPALADHLADALAVRRRHTMLHPICWFTPRPSYVEAFERVSGLSGPAAEAAAYRLVEGEETVVTHLADCLYEMARDARKVPRLAALIADPPPDALAQIEAMPEAAAFRTMWTRLMETFGERVGRGWGFEPRFRTPTWREEPAQVFALLTAYLDADVEHPARQRARARQATDAEVEVLLASCADRDAVAAFRQELYRARRVTTALDYHNHYIDQMAFGQLRHAVRAAACWLAGVGTLNTPDEAYWLTFDEILAALRAPGLVLGERIVERRIAERQARYAEWAHLEAPPILGVPSHDLPPRRPAASAGHTPAGSGGQVRGLGASRGRYTGIARVTLDPSRIPDLSPGDVLVAENVAPLWTPLLPVLGALVLDTGGLGQHAAATAREHGIPAVCDTLVATQRIPDGAQVTVDGTQGTVDIHAPSGNHITRD
jgi:phosphohistidine swiveling domain-containing protein